jgi:hypothetical protein
MAGSRVRVELATPVEGWHEHARECVGVRLIEADASAGVLVVVGGTLAQASVLKHLVDAGLPVAGFHAERENLHDSYLRTVHEGTQP